MKSQEFTAKTVEEALGNALRSMDLQANEVTYDVLEQPSKGFFGIGGKNAVIRVTEIFSAERVGKKFLLQTFADMGLEAEVEVSKKEEYILFNIKGEKLGILIGRRGDTLDALQFLLNLVMNKQSEERIKGIINIENYREKREETLKNLGLRLAEKAKKTGQRIVLEPMNPQERRIIHMTLQDDKMITTFSEGEEPYRKVVIVPKNRKKPRYNNHRSNNDGDASKDYKKDYKLYRESRDAEKNKEAAEEGYKKISIEEYTEE